MAGLTLILGGAKSGKTGLALELCQAFPAPRIYLATAQALDTEMSDRIARHQAERGPEWRTVEEPLEAPAIIRGLQPGEASVVLLDCLTLWLSNLLAGQGLSVDEAVARVEDLGAAVGDCPSPVIIVSNEVGLGIVPDNKLAREFRDAAGMSHQLLARRADEVLLVTAGLVRKIK